MERSSFIFFRLCAILLAAVICFVLLKNNLIYAFDGEGDSKALKAVNLADSVAEPYLRTRANLKVGFKHVNGNEIVLYS